MQPLGRPLRDRIMSTLAFHMRHRNNDGAKEVMRVRRFLVEAGGEEKLKRIVVGLCNHSIHSTKDMHPSDARRWRLWKESL